MPELLTAPSPFAKPLPLSAPGSVVPTLLLVEDSRFAAEAVRLVCQRLGIRLRRAESLVSARVHMRVYRPDIAVVDLGLPDGSGLELIEQWRDAAARPGRVLATSGDPSLEGAALQRGADAFLLKPLSLHSYLAALLDDGAPSAPAPDTPDPVALRDDLRALRGILQTAPDRAGTAYAGQFLSSVGCMMGQTALAADAAAAGMQGDPARLSALIDRFAPDDAAL